MKKSAKSKSKDEAEYVVVYSTEKAQEKHCATCKRAQSKCNCSPNLLAAVGKLTPSVRFERKGRGGKSVTIVSKLPAHETLLKKLLKSLKSQLGCGGTSYVIDGEGVIEIQGEQQERILDLLLKWDGR